MDYIYTKASKTSGERLGVAKATAGHTFGPPPKKPLNYIIASKKTIRESF